MATAVLQAQDIKPFQHEIMNASPLGDGQARTRHGRSKHGGSSPKALVWIFKHGEDIEELELDDEGFADCEELLSWQHFQSLQVTLPEIQAVVAHDPRQRFVIKTIPGAASNSTDPADWAVGTTQTTNAAKELAEMTPITVEAENIPETAIYTTTYAAYPLILASGGLKNTSGARKLRFSTEVSEDAEVLIYVDVFRALEDEPAIAWYGNEAKSTVVTDGNASGVLEKKFWKKVVGRKFEVGTLFEDGEEIKEVPANLRGKKQRGTNNKSKRGEKSSRVSLKSGEIRELSSEDESHESPE